MFSTIAVGLPGTYLLIWRAISRVLVIGAPRRIADDESNDFVFVKFLRAQWIRDELQRLRQSQRQFLLAVPLHSSPKLDRNEAGFCHGIDGRIPGALIGRRLLGECRRESNPKAAKKIGSLRMAPSNIVPFSPTMKPRMS
jgi:hypothetical protein